MARSSVTSAEQRAAATKIAAATGVKYKSALRSLQRYQTTAGQQRTLKSKRAGVLIEQGGEDVIEVISDVLARAHLPRLPSLPKPATIKLPPVIAKNGETLILRLTRESDCVSNRRSEFAVTYDRADAIQIARDIANGDGDYEWLTRRAVIIEVWFRPADTRFWKKRHQTKTDRRRKTRETAARDEYAVVVWFCDYPEKSKEQKSEYTDENLSEFQTAFSDDDFIDDLLYADDEDTDWMEGEY